MDALTVSKMAPITRLAARLAAQRLAAVVAALPSEILLLIFEAMDGSAIGPTGVSRRWRECALPVQWRRLVVGIPLPTPERPIPPTLRERLAGIRSMPHLSPYVRELVLTGSPACEDFPVLEICDVMETSAHFGHARSMELAYLALRSCGHPEGRDLLRFQQAYQASSRVISIARDTFQTLLDIR